MDKWAAKGASSALCDLCSLWPLISAVCAGFTSGTTFGSYRIFQESAKEEGWRDMKRSWDTQFSPKIMLVLRKNS